MFCNSNDIFIDFIKYNLIKKIQIKYKCKEKGKNFLIIIANKYTVIKFSN